MATYVPHSMCTTACAQQHVYNSMCTTTNTASLSPLPPSPLCWGAPGAGGVLAPLPVMGHHRSAAHALGAAAARAVCQGGAMCCAVLYCVVSDVHNMGEEPEVEYPCIK